MLASQGVVWLIACAGLAQPNDIRDQNAPILEQMLREPPHDGLLVFEVLPGLQASKAGVQVGDILTDYDGKRIRTVSQLQRVATLAAKENRKALPAVFMRGTKEIQADFDAAPMGLRFTAVAKGDRRILWRSSTSYTPDFRPVSNAIQAGHHWQIIQFAGKNIGWSHTYFQHLSDRSVMRVQSQSASEQLKEKRDLVLTFDPTSRNLAIKSYRLLANDKLALDMHVLGGAFSGTRFGIRDSAAMPVDCVCADLAGFVASCMPREKGACLRCSYLEAGSVVAAPYADLYCLGADQTDVGSAKVSAFRYDQTVFGRSVAHYWVNINGEVVKTRFGNGFTAIRSSAQEVRNTFPESTQAFPAIEQLPNLDPPAQRFGQ
jgi:hypothetical protein